jgi:hypothetical protein
MSLVNRASKFGHAKSRITNFKARFLTNDLRRTFLLQEHATRPKESALYVIEFSHSYLDFKGKVLWTCIGERDVKHGAIERLQSSKRCGDGKSRA